MNDLGWKNFHFDPVAMAFVAFAALGIAASVRWYWRSVREQDGTWLDDYGLRFVHGDESGYLPFRDIAGVSLESSRGGARLVVDSRDGIRRELAGSADLHGAILPRLVQQSPSIEADALARQGVAFHEWLERLDALDLGKDTGYRDGALPMERLAHIAEDTSLDPEAGAAALFLLVRSETAEARACAKRVLDRSPAPIMITLAHAAAPDANIVDPAELAEARPYLDPALLAELRTRARIPRVRVAEPPPPAAPANAVRVAIEPAELEAEDEPEVDEAPRRRS